MVQWRRRWRCIGRRECKWCTIFVWRAWLHWRRRMAWLLRKSMILRHSSIYAILRLNDVKKWKALFGSKIRAGHHGRWSQVAAKSKKAKYYECDYGRRGKIVLQMAGRKVVRNWREAQWYNEMAGKRNGLRANRIKGSKRYKSFLLIHSESIHISTWALEKKKRYGAVVRNILI